MQLMSSFLPKKKSLRPHLSPTVFSLGLRGVRIIGLKKFTLLSRIAPFVCTMEYHKHAKSQYEFRGSNPVVRGAVANLLTRVRLPSGIEFLGFSPRMGFFY